MRRVLQVLSGGLFVVACLVHLVAQAVVDPYWIVATIWVPVLLLLGWYVATIRRWGLTTTATALGLVFSWLGDGLGSISFLIKIALFLVAQICYVIAFQRIFRNHWGQHRRFRPWWLAYGVLVVTLVVLVAPYTGNLFVAVVLYGVVLGSMALLATGLGVVGALGGILFLVSDGLLAIQEFAGWRFPGQGLVIMATYLGAQALLAWAVASRPAQESELVGA